MARTFITTDTHFGHELMVDVCGRPVDFDRRIEERLLHLTNNDLLIHLGDISLSREKNQDVHRRYIEPLPCHKVLVRGNHDRETNSWYLEHGWDFVCDNFVDRIMGDLVLFSHVLMEMPSGIDVNIYGHFHNNPFKVIREYDRLLLERLTEHHICLSLEDMNYQPLLLDDVLKSYYTGKKVPGVRLVSEERA